LNSLLTHAPPERNRDLSPPELAVMTFNLNRRHDIQFAQCR